MTLVTCMGVGAVPVDGDLRGELDARGALVMAWAGCVADLPARPWGIRPDLIVVGSDRLSRAIEQALAVVADLPHDHVIAVGTHAHREHVLVDGTGRLIAYVCRSDVSAGGLAGSLLAMTSGRSEPFGADRLVREDHLMRAQRVGGRPPGDLTAVERTAAARLTQGATTAEIAAELGLSELTARRVVSTARRKLLSRDREQATRLASSAVPEERSAPDRIGDDGAAPPVRDRH